jgi:hypothetical protein
MPSSMALPEEQSTHLRPLLESVTSTAVRLGIGQTKVWALIRDGRLEVVYLGHRTLVAVESTDRLVAELRAEASNREPSEWSRRCGPLASVANKGRRRARAKIKTRTALRPGPHENAA